LKSKGDESINKLLFARE